MKYKKYEKCQRLKSARVKFLSEILKMSIKLFSALWHEGTWGLCFMLLVISGLELAFYQSSLHYVIVRIPFGVHFRWTQCLWIALTSYTVLCLFITCTASRLQILSRCVFFFSFSIHVFPILSLLWHSQPLFAHFRLFLSLGFGVFFSFLSCLDSSCSWFSVSCKMGGNVNCCLLNTRQILLSIQFKHRFCTLKNVLGVTETGDWMG